MPKKPNPRTEQISFSVTPTLKSTLEAEAWEEQRSLSDYVRGLLERRGRWARTVGRSAVNSYDIGPAKK
jgi:hypothetical protein